MSRSYRAPWITDGYKGSKRKQFFKRDANSCIRHIADIPDGNAYRKFYDTWSICDYRFPYDPNPFIRCWRGYPELIEPTPFWRVTRK
jgi:hypothetical protein